jgi:tRNA (guanine37-N1)-methyltransferase
MKITILTLFPEMYEGFLNTSIIKKAILKELVEVELIDIRPFSKSKTRRVDDYPFGGGQGLVMAVQPIKDALSSVKKTDSYVVMTSASGNTFTQAKARSLSQQDHLIILCGHYEGFDERLVQLCDEEVSIGDYVLTGGELPSMVISDAIIRLKEGVIKEASHRDESYEQNLLEYPQYTRPEHLEEGDVPAVLMNGNHEAIRKYRLKESLRKTWLKRPDLFKDKSLSAEETKLLIEVLLEHIKKD